VSSASPVDVVPAPDDEDDEDDEDEDDEDDSAAAVVSVGSPPDVVGAPPLDDSAADVSVDSASPTGGLGRKHADVTSAAHSVTAAPHNRRTLRPFVCVIMGASSTMLRPQRAPMEITEDTPCGRFVEGLGSAPPRHRDGPASNVHILRSVDLLMHCVE
jgi:hypothetical protein